MTSYTTKTAEFGEVTFSAPSASDDRAGYVWIETEKGYAAKDRRQICYGGDFTGGTVTAKPDTIKEEAKRWLRQRREWMRKEGL